MPYAGISDLAVDILVNILEDSTIPTEILYFLALLSRRLNYIALSLYFSWSIDPETKSVTITLYAYRLDPLPALNKCLWISSMERVECIFPDSSSMMLVFDEIRIVPFLGQMKRVEAFFSRLTSVKEVVLKLDSTPNGRCLARGSDETLRRWATHLQHLLNCILERGCSSLTVMNGKHFIEANQVDPPRISAGVLARVDPKGVAAAEGKDTQLHCGRRWVDHTAVLRSSLSTQLLEHRLDYTLQFVPPGLYLTLAALRQSPITSLVIRMSLVGPHIWSTVLPFIASACLNLTRVSLTQLPSPSEYPDAPTETLALAFLARLPRLADVELTHRISPYGLSFGLHRTKGPAKSLKYLTKLRAPANLVEHLLSLPSKLPAIRAICILWTAPSHPHLRTLTRFLLSITRTLARRRLAPELSLWIESLSWPIYEDTTVLRGLGDTEHKQLACIERLHLENLIIPGDSRPFLEPVMAAFQGLKQVSVTTFPLEASVLPLVQQLRATDALKSIEVNGKSYDLPS
ncbi:hypothetical protein DFH08DRAFT_1025795 [Mycena albidolilacea]|uniref:F-box domain-containing protein n=1 Tax=Mycena albidolilacea TaxID=1033008 RepID=A0AAD7ANY1_9AGAR|nr:hypothetical protein DFH08DRAFT_1025795 [Mycena albidolilacea]